MIGITGVGALAMIGILGELVTDGVRITTVQGLLIKPRWRNVVR